MTTYLAEPCEREAGQTRRSVVRGVAWAAPVAVFTAFAPVYAASPCVPSSMNYASTAVGASPDFTLGGVRVTMSVTSRANTGSVLPANGTIGHDVRQTSGSTSTSLLGNTTNNNLLLNLDGDATTTLTITFSAPVSNLQLEFRDVTWRANNRSRDSLAFSPAASSYTGLGTNAGNVTSPPAALQRTADGSNDGAGSVWYDARVTFAGPLSKVTVTYSNSYVPTGTEKKGTVATGLYAVSFCA